MITNNKNTLIMDQQPHSLNTLLAIALATLQPIALAWPAVPFCGCSPSTTNIPVANALIPFSFTPAGSSGECIIFNSTFDDPNPANYQLEYTATGGNFDSRGGPTTKIIPGLVSGNLSFYINTSWLGTTAVSVRLQVRDIPANIVYNLPQDWVFQYRTTFPTTITQVETDKERPLGSVYTYVLGGPRILSYLHHTILEKFQQPICNITYEDLKPSFKAANPGIRTVEQITNHFFGGPGGNGTFTIDENNQIYDIHGGGIPPLATFQAALILKKEIRSDLPQIYEAQPGRTLAKYIVSRIMKKDGTMKLRKFREL